MSATSEAITRLADKAARSYRAVRGGLDQRIGLATVTFRSAAQKALRRQPRRNLVQWTEEVRRHAANTKAPGTPVRVSDMEVTRGPYLWVHEPGVKECGLMACTQSGKTTIMEAIVGYHAHGDPCPILYVGPSEADAIQFTDQKLMAMFRASPELKPLVNESRTSGNTNVMKRFPGGRFRAGSSDTRRTFTMVPERVGILDEVDGHENAGGDGDTYVLTKGRFPEYSHNSFLFAGSSPTVFDRGKGLPCIWKIFQSGDRRLPYVQCQGCGFDHFMEFEHEPGRYSLHIPTEGGDPRGEFMPDGAVYVCPRCGHAHDQRDRLRMVRAGAIHWRATKPFKCCDEYQDPARSWADSAQDREAYERLWQPWGEPLGVPAIGFGERGVDRAKCRHCGRMPVRNRVASGRYGRYYRPQYSLAEMAADWIAVIRDPAKRRAFWNTVVGLPFAEKKNKAITAEALGEQGERWDAKPPVDAADPFERPVFYVPDPVAIETLAVDVQQGAEDGSGSRFAIERVGWGPGEESWSLDYHEPAANTRDLSEWNRVLLPEIERADHRRDGRVFLPMAVCIDAGNNPDQAAAFVAMHQMRLRSRGIFLFAVKGVGDKGSATYRTWAGAATDAKSFNRFADGSVKLWNVGVREAKDTIAAHLAVPHGPGAMHFPRERTDLWIKGMLSEVQVEKGGRLVWEHQDKSVRNEPLDCRVYALAGLRAVQAMYPAWSLEAHAKLVGATAAVIPEAEPADDGAPVDDRLAATAETAVRLHQALTAVAETGRVAREGAGAGQSPASTTPAPPPPPAPADEPWMVDTGWQPPAMPWD